jgi:hypothetical protein
MVVLSGKSSVNEALDDTFSSQSTIATMDFHAIGQDQVNICKQYGQQFLACPGDSIMGVAFRDARTRPSAWAEAQTKRRDERMGHLGRGVFFCGRFLLPAERRAHTLDRALEIINYLILQPGCRFLLAEEYADVWFDAALLVA